MGSIDWSDLSNAMGPSLDACKTFPEFLNIVRVEFSGFGPCFQVDLIIKVFIFEKKTYILDRYKT